MPSTKLIVILCLACWTTGMAVHDALIDYEQDEGGLRFAPQLSDKERRNCAVCKRLMSDLDEDQLPYGRLYHAVFHSLNYDENFPDLVQGLVQMLEWNPNLSDYSNRMTADDIVNVYHRIMTYFDEEYQVPVLAGLFSSTDNDLVSGLDLAYDPPNRITSSDRWNRIMDEIEAGRLPPVFENIHPLRTNQEGVLELMAQYDIQDSAPDRDFLLAMLRCGIVFQCNFFFSHFRINPDQVAAVYPLLAVLDQPGLCHGALAWLRVVEGEYMERIATNVIALPQVAALFRANPELFVSEIAQNPKLFRLVAGADFCILRSTVNTQFGPQKDTHLHEVCRRADFDIMRTLLSIPEIDVTTQNALGQVAIEYLPSSHIRLFLTKIPAEKARLMILSNPAAFYSKVVRYYQPKSPDPEIVNSIRKGREKFVDRLLAVLSLRKEDDVEHCLQCYRCFRDQQVTIASPNAPIIRESTTSKNCFLC